MNLRVVPAMLGVLFSIGLTGCDIAKEERISGTPVNGGAGATLDPDVAGNIAGYFYLDRPVAGLNFICSASGQLPVAGETDLNGRFVCPRNTVIAFYLGYPGELKLGEVTLSMYGATGDLEVARNYVTVNPGTLNGTTVDSDDNRTTNIFNLLTSLEAPPVGGANDVLRISEEVDFDFAAYADQLNLGASPATFGFALQAVTEAIEAPVGQQLRRNGAVMDLLELQALTDASLLRARSGMYLTSIPLSDSDASGKRWFTGTVSMAMSRTGHLAGLALYSIIDQSTTPSTQTVSIGPLVDASRISAAGALLHGAGNDGLLFRLSGTDPLLVTGSFINDSLFGDLLKLYPDNNSSVPSTYVVNSTDVGEFDFRNNEFHAGAYLSPLDLNTPTIDLSLLPGGFLPRTVGVMYKAYPDGLKVEDAQRTSSTYLSAQTPRPMFFRMLRSGDIVSDVDFDCSEVQVVGGQLQDADGSAEYYIGQIGNVFTDGPDGAKTAYMTIRLAIYEPAHPDYGFTLGTPALGRDTLGSVVYDVQRGELRSKRCRPEDDPCEHRVEWFDDEEYLGTVVKGVVENGLVDAAADAAFRVPTYYGQVTVDNGNVCPPT